MIYPQPKMIPVTDEDFRAWVKMKKCLLKWRLQCIGGTDVAHVKTRGSGGGDPANIVPLCRGHHTEQHKIGVASFEKKYDLNLSKQAESLWKIYVADQIAERDPARSQKPQ